ncbi:hypothetical protein [Rubritalea tangerina]|uniref:hypothetical protein n=1 Tax=Rubritalea tangerina TaxID=430798 RepID=UPI00361A5AD9
MNDSIWMHWSGGKDSAYALTRLLNEPSPVTGLVTSSAKNLIVSQCMESEKNSSKHSPRSQPSPP